MAEIAAFPIETLSGVMTTDDGLHTLIKAVMPNGAAIDLALPTSQMGNLIEMAAFGLTDGRKKQGIPKEEILGFPATWFEIGIDALSGQTILTMTIGAGGKITFMFDKVMAAQMLETLQVGLGRPTEIIAPSIKN